MKHDMAWDPVADLIESLQSMRSTFLRAFSRSNASCFSLAPTTLAGLSSWVAEARSHPFVFAGFAAVALMLGFVTMIFMDVALALIEEKANECTTKAWKGTFSQYRYL